MAWSTESLSLEVIGLYPSDCVGGKQGDIEQDVEKGARKHMRYRSWLSGKKLFLCKSILDRAFVLLESMCPLTIAQALRWQRMIRHESSCIFYSGISPVNPKDFGDSTIYDVVDCQTRCPECPSPQHKYLHPHIPSIGN